MPSVTAVFATAAAEIGKAAEALISMRSVFLAGAVENTARPPAAPAPPPAVFETDDTTRSRNEDHLVAGLVIPDCCRRQIGEPANRRTQRSIASVPRGCNAICSTSSSSVGAAIAGLPATMSCAKYWLASTVMS